MITREKTRLPYSRSTKGVRGSTTKYEEVQGSMRKYEGVPRKYQGSTRGVRREYDEVWEVRKSRFSPLAHDAMAFMLISGFAAAYIPKSGN
jgi:hypothetical protein